MQCKYDHAYAGRCTREAMEGSEYCEEHAGLKCSSCGKQATHECDAGLGPVVCGAPLCNDCVHTICENGCTSGAKRPKGLGEHSKKSEQVFKPWFITSFEENAISLTITAGEQQSMPACDLLDHSKSIFYLDLSPSIDRLTIRPDTKVVKVTFTDGEGNDWSDAIPEKYHAMIVSYFSEQHNLDIVSVQHLHLPRYMPVETYEEWKKVSNDDGYMPFVVVPMHRQAFILIFPRG